MTSLLLILKVFEPDYSGWVILRAAPSFVILNRLSLAYLRPVMMNNMFLVANITKITAGYMCKEGQKSNTSLKVVFAASESSDSSSGNFRHRHWKPLLAAGQRSVSCPSLIGRSRRRSRGLPGIALDTRLIFWPPVRWRPGTNRWALKGPSLLGSCGRMGMKGLLV